MLKTLIRFIIAILLGILVVAALKYKTLKKLHAGLHLFDEALIVDNFQNMDKHFDVKRLSPSSEPYIIPKNISFDLTDEFNYNGKNYSVPEYLEYTKTEGLMILHRDTIIFEQYTNGLTENTTHISWSMAKSVVATLLGIANDDGLFKLNEPITKYLPQFKETGYDGVKIKDILQMSSGVGFNEDYGDLKSDINRFGIAFTLGSSYEKFSLSLKREREPGTYCHYVSIDTQVLGYLLSKITGKSITEYFKEKLWEPMGMQDNCEWVIDKTGFELALGGLNMTLRDFAKLGQLYLHNGEFNGKQIISADWVKMAVTPDAPHLMPGNHGMSSHEYGYGFQWWVPNPDEGEYFASGIYNQYIFVNPAKDLVIIKLSANHHYKKEGKKEKGKHISLLKAISRDFKQNETTNNGEQAN